MTTIDPATFDRDGYAVADRVVGPDVVEGLIAALTPPEPTAATRRRGGEAFARRNLFDVRAVAELAASAALADLVRPLVGTAEPKPVRAILFDKTPAANWVVPWHQDLSIAVRERRDVAGFGPWSVKAGVVHVQPPAHVLGGMVTVRLHLDDCGPDNGPLRVIPGSHTALLRDDALAARVAAGPEVACTAPAGGAVVMRPMILHASSPARSPAHRRVVHIEYAPDQPLDGGLEWAVG